MHWCNRAVECGYRPEGKKAHQSLPHGQHADLESTDESRVAHGYSDSDDDFDPLSFTTHGCTAEPAPGTPASGSNSEAAPPSKRARPSA
eukprot:6049106-Alexandrium_andersonii.AAC.1